MIYSFDSCCPRPLAATTNTMTTNLKDRRKIAQYVEKIRRKDDSFVFDPHVFASARGSVEHVNSHLKKMFPFLSGYGTDCCLARVGILHKLALLVYNFDLKILHERRDLFFSSSVLNKKREVDASPPALAPVRML